MLYKKFNKSESQDDQIARGTPACMKHCELHNQVGQNNHIEIHQRPVILYINNTKIHSSLSVIYLYILHFQNDLSLDIEHLV